MEGPKKQSPKIAPEFESVEKYNQEINETGYARYNYQELIDREANLTQMIEGAKDVALFNSGAGALHSAIESEDLKAGDVVFCANAVYGTTKTDVEQLQNF